VLNAVSVFRAVADPTRRELLDSLLSGEKTASELCAGFSATQQAISLHLQSLRRAGLVQARKVGRFRRYRLKPEPIREMYEWVVKYREVFDPFGHAWAFGKFPERTHSKARAATSRRRKTE